MKRPFMGSSCPGTCIRTPSGNGFSGFLLTTVVLSHSDVASSPHRGHNLISLFLCRWKSDCEPGSKGIKNTLTFEMINVINSGKTHFQHWSSLELLPALALSYCDMNNKHLSVPGTDWIVPWMRVTPTMLMISDKYFHCSLKGPEWFTACVTAAQRCETPRINPQIDNKLL